MATKIVVAGDASVDWYYWPRSSHLSKEDVDWKLYEGAKINPQPAGAVLLAEWLRRLLQIGAGDSPYLLASQSRENLVKKGLSEVVHTNVYLDLFPPFPSSEKCSSDKREKTKVYRVKNYLGHIAPDNKKDYLLSLGIFDDQEDADFVVIYDSGSDFRSEQQAWPKAIKGENKPIVIYVMYPPFFKGELWKHVMKFHKERLILILNVDDLRKTGVNISRALSWEKSAMDFLLEVKNNEYLKDIKELSNVVTRFNYEGAIHYRGKTEKSKLYFDPLSIEGEFWNYKRFGNMRSTSLIFIANLSSCLISKFEENKASFTGNKTNFQKNDSYQTCIENTIIEGLEEGLKEGLVKSREFLINGYGNSNGKPDFFEYACFNSNGKKEESTGRKEEATLDKACFSTCLSQKKSSESVSGNITDTLLPSIEEINRYSNPEKSTSTFWTILKEKTKEKSRKEAHENDSTYLEKLAFLIVKKGLSSVKDFPIGKFGKLITVDRAEIESFRSIKNVMKEYIYSEDYSEQNIKPLSIAVFGAPGSGKSFGVTQVAESIDSERVRKITFNISQFTSTKDLANAFHRVRDVSLEGKIPLVFFDEFDSKFENEELGWLKYFLVPMQDGEFMDFESMHPIGKSIFVFAGSAYETFKDFYDFCNYSNAQNKSYSGTDSCRKVTNKCPDFLSRLRGYVNILGLNKTNEEDETYIIRRAIQLRSLIEANAPKIIRGNYAHISCSLLNALINVPEYMHGARSMLAIVEMSILHERSSWQTAYLPPKDQLELHIKSIDDFYKLLAQKKQSCTDIK